MKANEAREKAKFNYDAEVDRLARRTIDEIMPHIETSVERGKFSTRLPWDICQSFYDKNVLERTKHLMSDDGYKLSYVEGNGLIDPHDAEPSYYLVEW